ncbi:uncharacterized protein LOC106159283, partial [Lingula anatina]|uniref:Uncharacterized protein LOC106159283 n=1 Tax=Lingula anatina TaxID=7574 RepID=A0A1S3HY76_LINAN
MGSLLRSYILGLLGLFSMANVYVGAEYRYIHIRNEENGEMVECREIQCEKGQYAKPCTPDDRDSSRCVPCEDGYYQDDNVNPLRKECKLKKRCLDQNPDIKKCTTVKDPGSLTRDATCSCLQGCTWYKSLAECIPDDPSVRPTTPRPSCPPGQTTKENSTGCFPECPEGFFKDGDSCKQYTNCRREGKCVEIKGNATADNICSAANFTDWTKDCNQTGSSQQQKSEGPKMLKIILGVTVPGVILCALAIIAYCAWKWTTNKKNEEQNRQEILARLTSGTLEGEALRIAFGIVENNMRENWERLGRRLLENFDTTVRFEIYEAYPPSSTPLADRVSRMLTIWKEKRARDATVAALLRALDFIGQGNISQAILQKIKGLLSETDSTNFTDENRDLAVHSSSVPDVHETARR